MKNGLFATTLLTSLTIGAALVLSSCEKAAPPENKAAFNVVEASIPEMQKAMQDGRVTAEDLVRQYLIRIATYENVINAAIAVNPNALAEARALDEERKAGKIRGPLHGIPVALKDNIQTVDMPTTGGTLGLAGFMAPWDAPLAKNLKDGGAIIIAKTTLTELANYFGNGMPGNYSSISGYSYNPYDPRRDLRAGQNDGRPVMGTGGSSSGAGTAANFWAVNVGTETSGSILSPSNQNMLAGIKPTVGRISRTGVIPITADQDTAGPMGKSVTDVAIMFGVLEGKQPDPNDSATTRCTPPADNDYTPHLKADALKGARIGVPRIGYGTAVTPPGMKETRGEVPEDQMKAFEEAVAILKQAGAEIVDPADFPSYKAAEQDKNPLSIGACDRPGSEASTACTSVLAYGMHRDFNAWLAAQNGKAPFKTLDELVAWNEANKNLGTIKYTQSSLIGALANDLEKSKAKYEADRKRDIELNGAQGIDAAMTENKLDALLFAGARGAAVAAKPGYPTVIVPFAMVANPPTPAYPEGFNPLPMPMGISFTGMACSEPRLIELAYAFEQLTKKRQPPPNMP
ncbi:MAG: amidase family protein [Rhodospirillaceae bacterium]